MPQDRLQALARYILEERERRRWHFPKAVFDEIPWEMLLLLYASQSGSLSRASVANGILAAPAVVDRWVEYLEREGLVMTDPRRPRELRLTAAGLSSLELYLRDRLQRGLAANARPGPRAGLRGWRLAFLLLATAILSAMLGGAIAAA
jgi:hypothetical protein